MEVKKTDKANLEDKRNTFFLIGLVLVLALVWGAFEIKTYNRKVQDVVTMAATDLEEDLVLQTQRNEPPPPPPPPQQQVTMIQIVDNDVKIDDDFEINIEADDQTEIVEHNVAQETEKEEVEEEIFVFVEENPSYPGGDEARIKYLVENIKYPDMAKESNIQGIVYVTFVVEKDGRVSNVKVLRGIGGGCDEEAVRVIQKMPNWAPGKQRGRAVRAQFNMPVRFTLAS